MGVCREGAEGDVHLRKLCRRHGPCRGRLGDLLRSALCPLSTTASFTTYSAGGFTLDDQALLARLARHTAAHKGVPVLISNHDIELTRELYRGARLDEILVKRTISRNGGGRNKVAELLALYPPASSPNRAIIPVRRSWLPSAE